MQKSRQFSGTPINVPLVPPTMSCGEKETEMAARTEGTCDLRFGTRGFALFG